MKEELTSLPNIGKVLAERLQEVGITTIEELKNVGSENAFIRLQKVDKDACLHKFMAIEGAIQGIRWHDLEESCKVEIKAVYRQIKSLT